MKHSHEPQKPVEETEREPESQRDSDAAAGASEACAEEREVRPETELLERLEAEREQMRQTLVRRQADFDNFRKRIERERREDRDRAVAQLAEALLPVLDNFERALAAHRDPAYEEYQRGFEMIYRQLTDLLAEHGITRMEDPTGTPFDPHLHHAFDRVETDEQPEGTILTEVQAGYRFRNRVLRPAQVRVAGRPRGEEESPSPVN